MMSSIENGGERRLHTNLVMTSLHIMRYSLSKLTAFTYLSNSKAVVLNLYKHTEPLPSFPSFCQAPFYFPKMTESKNWF